MASPSDPDDLTPDEEGQLRQQVVEGIHLALEDKGLTDREITKTEVEKLLFFAIQDLDLPLTYSWYLAGSKTAYAPSETTGPAGPQEPATPSFGDLQSEQTVEADVQRYREYFRSTTFFDDYNLRKVIFTDKHDFLCDFYREFADEKYTDLYIRSTNLREKLENLNKELQKASGGTSLTEWGGGSDDGVLSRNKENDIRRKVSLLHLELAGIDGLEKTRTPVHRGTDVIENVLTRLTHLQSVTDEQARLVNELDDFFYDYVWKFPALKISAETATGPNAEQRKQSHQWRFGNFESTLFEQIEKRIEEHEEAGLEPSIDEFSTNEDWEILAHFHEVTKEVVSPDHE